MVRCTKGKTEFKHLFTTCDTFQQFIHICNYWSLPDDKSETYLFEEIFLHVDCFISPFISFYIKSILLRLIRDT